MEKKSDIMASARNRSVQKVERGKRTSTNLKPPLPTQQVPSQSGLHHPPPHHHHPTPRPPQKRRKGRKGEKSRAAKELVGAPVLPPQQLRAPRQDYKFKV